MGKMLRICKGPRRPSQCDLPRRSPRLSGSAQRGAQRQTPRRAMQPRRPRKTRVQSAPQPKRPRQQQLVPSVLRPKMRSRTGGAQCWLDPCSSQSGKKRGKQNHILQKKMRRAEAGKCGHCTASNCAWCLYTRGRAPEKSAHLHPPLKLGCLP